MDTNFSDKKYRSLHLTYLNHVVSSIWSNPDDYLILDTETTGLIYCDQIIEMAITNLKGEIVYHSLFNSTREIQPGAQKCHGLTMECIAQYPYFKDQWEGIYKLIKDKTLLIYNSSFDVEMINNTLQQQWVKHDLIIKNICVMKLWAIYIGDWNRNYDNYRWQKLEGGHRATSDVLKVWELLKIMRDNPKSEELSMVVEESNIYSLGICDEGEEVLKSEF